MKRSFFRSILIAALMAGIAPVTAQINCRTDRNQVERWICNSPDLMALDREMSRKYWDISEELRRRPRAWFRDNQRDWLAARNACDSRACVRDVYVDRIAAFDEVLARMASE